MEFFERFYVLHTDLPDLTCVPVHTLITHIETDCSYRTTVTFRELTSIHYVEELFHTTTIIPLTPPDSLHFLSDTDTDFGF